MTRSYFPNEPSLDLSPSTGLRGGVCSLMVHQEQDKAGTWELVRTKRAWHLWQSNSAWLGQDLLIWKSR